MNIPRRGLSTEDPDIRNAMVEKRFKKLALMKADMRMPSVFCDESVFFPDRVGGLQKAASWKPV